MILQQDPTIPKDKLDGSIAQIVRFLCELIELTGQGGQATPVLELQLGEILTRTTVLMADQNYLLITAYMPRCDFPYYISQSNEAISLQAADGIEYMWHADEGRHIAVRRICAADLPDERSVMDAIATTSELAAAWFASRRDSKSTPRR